MDKVEKYFQENQENFDFLQPDAETWQGIADRISPKTPTIQKRHFWSRLSVAAALLALISIASLFMIYNNNFDQNEVVGIDLEEQFPDVVLRDPDGHPIALSSLKGKVVLVEFWASFSKVCTDNHCFYFKPLYEEYKDKGFEIYAISVDSSASKWINALAEEELGWVQVSDLEGKQSPFLQSFSLDQLPITFLLDENGKVIAKDIDAENLAAQLNSVFALN